MPPETGHLLEEIVEEQHKQGEPPACWGGWAPAPCCPWFPWCRPYTIHCSSIAVEERAKAMAHQHQQQPHKEDHQHMGGEPRAHAGAAQPS